jgi:nitroreductase
MTPDDLSDLIARRRSNLLVDPTAPVSDDDIDALVTAAQWAPNHKRTWPLRVCVVTGDSRRILGEAIAASMAARGDDAAKVEKTRTKYSRSPVVIVVASAVGASDTETIENSYSVAAGMQNLLLTAEARGLAALWGSPAKGANAAITDFCGMETTDSVVGLVYVGHPTRTAAPVERPAPRVTRRG